MSEKKQTAVEMILSHLPLWMRNRLSENGVTAQALQMEREQIEEAYGDGYCDRHSDEITVNTEIEKL